MSSDPPDPRSPRLEPAPNPPLEPALNGQTTFLDQQPQRPNIGSMLFLTAFFFFMSSSNNQPQIIVVGPDGQIQPRVTELDRARIQVEEYRGLINGTGNWTEGAVPQILPVDVLPSRFHHKGQFYTNITGFQREGRAHTVNLTNPSSGAFFENHPSDPFFERLPNFNGTSWNGTLAEEMRGDWDWRQVDKWEMNIKERDSFEDEWSWVKGVMTLGSLDFDFCGLHHLPNGTFELYGLANGLYLDLRNIPRLYPHHHNVTRRIVMRELQKELASQESSLLLTDVREGEFSDVVADSRFCNNHMLTPRPPLTSATSCWYDHGGC